MDSSLEEERALGLALGQTKRGTVRDNKLFGTNARDNGTGGTTKQDNKISEPAARDNKISPRYDVAAKLEEILDNPKASPQSKAAAGRTLAEMAGLIGRHQSAPDRGDTVPVGALSRAELEAELARLRDKLKLTR